MRNYSDKQKWKFGQHTSRSAPIIKFSVGVNVDGYNFHMVFASRHYRQGFPEGKPKRGTRKSKGLYGISTCRLVKFVLKSLVFVPRGSIGHDDGVFHWSRAIP